MDNVSRSSHDLLMQGDGGAQYRLIDLRDGYLIIGEHALQRGP